MIRTRWFVLLAIFIGMVAISLAQSSATKTLEAKVTYTGAGDVDSTYAVHLYLFPVQFPSAPHSTRVGSA